MCDKMNLEFKVEVIIYELGNLVLISMSVKIHVATLEDVMFYLLCYFDESYKK